MVESTSQLQIFLGREEDRKETPSLNLRVMVLKGEDDWGEKERERREKEGSMDADRLGAVILIFVFKFIF